MRGSIAKDPARVFPKIHGSMEQISKNASVPVRIETYFIICVLISFIEFIVYLYNVYSPLYGYI